MTNWNYSNASSKVETAEKKTLPKQKFIPRFTERINPYVIILENDYLSRKISSEIIAQMPKAKKLDNREYEYNNMWYIMVNMLRVFTIASEINFFKEPFNIYTNALSTDDTNVLKSDTNSLLTLIGNNMHSRLSVLDTRKRSYQCRYPYISYLQYESPSKSKRDGFYFKEFIPAMIGIGALLKLHIYPTFPQEYDLVMGSIMDLCTTTEHTQRIPLSILFFSDQMYDIRPSHQIIRI